MKQTELLKHRRTTNQKLLANNQNAQVRRGISFLINLQIFVKMEFGALVKLFLFFKTFKYLLYLNKTW